MKTLRIQRYPVALACAGVLLAVAGIARAAEHVVDVVHTSSYVNGGIGDSEQARMRRIAPEFPLRMTFSERKDGEFIADVPVAISDMKGNRVFELRHAGPMLFVSLPDGSYRVTARFKGMAETQDVNVGGNSGKDLYFHWNSPKG